MCKYQRWIEENVTESYGMCKEVTLSMSKEFPELIRIRGHYYDYLWGERQHWWLETTLGVRIDPTKDQFPSKGTAEYVPWVEGSQEPTGKCPNCGDLIYDGGYTHEECHEEFARVCMGGSL